MCAVTHPSPFHSPEMDSADQRLNLRVAFKKAFHTLEILSDRLRHPKITPFKPLRQWIDRIEITHPQQAQLICRLIPNACPFERDVTFFGRLYHIPSLCKLNPFYDELIGLRFRALCYLADVCKE